MPTAILTANAPGATRPAEAARGASIESGNRATSLDPRLPPAAHAFEACLMKEFLEPLQRDPLFAGGGEGNDGEGSGGALMSFGAEALARGIADRGGFGIAAKIIEHFELGRAGKAEGI